MLGDVHEFRPRRHGPHWGVAIAWTREQHNLNQRRGATICRNS